MTLVEQYDLTVDEFVARITPELEQRVDEWIASQPPEDRATLRRHRQQILHEYVQATLIANYRQRLAQAEACLRPPGAAIH